MPRSEPMLNDWPFDEPRNVACFTTHAVLGGSLIRHLTPPISRLNLIVWPTRSFRRLCLIFLIGLC